MSSHPAFKDCIELNERAIGCMKEGRHIESTVVLRMAIEKLEECFDARAQSRQQSQSQSQYQYQQHPAGDSLSPSTPTNDQATATVSAPAINGISQAGPPSCPGRALQEMMETSAALNGAASEVNNRHSPAAHVNSRRRPSFVSISVESAGINAEQASLDNIFILYPRMFHIGLQDALTMDIIKVYVIVLYNLSLSRHINALLYLSDKKVSPERHLTAVLMLYEMIFKVAQTCLQHQDHMEMLNILVAAANNVGHISSHLLLFKETRDSIHRVLQMLALSDEVSFSSEEDLQNFFWSVCTFLEGHDLQIAPAA